LRYAGEPIGTGLMADPENTAVTASWRCCGAADRQSNRQHRDQLCHQVIGLWMVYTYSGAISYGDAEYVDSNSNVSIDHKLSTLEMDSTWTPSRTRIDRRQLFNEIFYYSSKHSFLDAVRDQYSEYVISIRRMFLDRTQSGWQISNLFRDGQMGDFCTQQLREVSVSRQRAHQAQHVCDEHFEYHIHVRIRIVVPSAFPRTGQRRDAEHRQGNHEPWSQLYLQYTTNCTGYEYSDTISHGDVEYVVINANMSTMYELSTLLCSCIRKPSATMIHGRQPSEQITYSISKPAWLNAGGRHDLDYVIFIGQMFSLRTQHRTEISLPLRWRHWANFPQTRLGQASDYCDLAYTSGTVRHAYSEYDGHVGARRRLAVMALHILARQLHPKHGSDIDFSFTR
jgi:hypothetical protein